MHSVVNFIIIPLNEHLCLSSVDFYLWKMSWFSMDICARVESLFLLNSNNKIQVQQERDSHLQIQKYPMTSKCFLSYFLSVNSGNPFVEFLTFSIVSRCLELFAIPSLRSASSNMFNSCSKKNFTSFFRLPTERAISGLSKGIF